LIDDLGVGGLAIVVITHATAEAEDPGGEGGFVEEPAADVHLVDALIAEIAIPGVPYPMPIVVQPGAAQWGFFGWAAPEVVVHASRDGLGAAGFSDAGPALITEAPRYRDLAEIAFPDPFHGFGDALTAAAALGSGLDDAPVFPGGLDELAAFPNVMGDWLFQIDIAPTLHRPNGTEGVPMIRGGDGYGVDVLGFEQFPDVPIALHFSAGFLTHFLHLPVQNFLIHITEADQPGTLHAGEGADVAASASAKADDGDADVGIGSRDL
jgi:hypothetical protein